MKFEVPLERSWPQDEYPIGAFLDYRIRVAKTAEPVWPFSTGITCNVSLFEFSPDRDDS